MDSAAKRQKLLFLSHSGVDSQSARKLVTLIEGSAEAKKLGLKVWFDKHDLRAGYSWQAQMEQALGESDAFAVYIGSMGIVNWVEREVCEALNRATNDPHYPFIPILSADAPDISTLPTFVRQFQGVFDVEHNPEQFQNLILAIAGQTRSQHPAPVTKPFVGLRPFKENDAHLFFGRDKEAQDLIQRLKEEKLLMLIGDSGSGKSSLVHAGLVPLFKGGALEDLSGQVPDDTVWYVLEMRPGDAPYEQLLDCVATTARKTDSTIKPKELSEIADLIRSCDKVKISDALFFSAPVNARILLVVDQFEELFTQVRDPSICRDFIDLLMYLVHGPKNRWIRAVLTMRRDYYNLCSRYGDFFEATQAGKYVVRRMQDSQLMACIQKPLKLAGVDDTEVFANVAIDDVGDQPGDLALLAMALDEVWRFRSRYNGDLLKTYHARGGVTGAVATVAQEIYETRLTDTEREICPSVFLRLVRLGDTGGTTRRVVGRNEFSEAQWKLLQKLAQEDHRRLIVIGGREWAASAEVCHEALVTQWPEYQQWLHDAAEYKRMHDPVINKARQWDSAVEGDKQEYLLTGNDLSMAGVLQTERPDLLSRTEEQYILASFQRSEAEQKKLQDLHRREVEQTRALYIEQQKRVEEQEKATRRLRRLSTGLAASLVLALAVAGYAIWQTQITGKARSEALAQLARNHWMAAVTARDHKNDELTAIHQFTSVAAITENPKFEANARLAARHLLGNTRLLAVYEGVGKFLENRIAISPDRRHFFTWDQSGEITQWDASSGQPVSERIGIGSPLKKIIFSRDGEFVATWTNQGTIKVWDTATGHRLGPAIDIEGDLKGMSFAEDPMRLLTWNNEGTFHIWNMESGQSIIEPKVEAVADLRVKLPKNVDCAVTSGNGTIYVWNTASGRPIAGPLSYTGASHAARFSEKGDRVLVWGGRRAWLYQLPSGDLITPPIELKDEIGNATWVKHGKQILIVGKTRYYFLNPGSGALSALSIPITEGTKKVGFSNDGSLLMTLNPEGLLKLWNTATAQSVFTVDSGMRDATGGFLDEPLRFLAWNSKEVNIWDAATGSNLFSYQPPDTKNSVMPDTINGVMLSADGRKVMVRTTHEVQSWDPNTGKPLYASPLSHNGFDLYNFSLSKNRRMAVTMGPFNQSGSDSLTPPGVARLWDTEYGKALSPFLFHGAAVREAWFLLNGTRLLTKTIGGTARLWEIEADRSMMRIIHSDKEMRGVGFSQDETRIVGWAGSKVFIWERDSGNTLAEIAHEHAVWGARLFNRDQYLSSWTKLGVGRTWNPETGAPIGAEMIHPGGFSGSILSDRENRILSWGKDGRILVWEAGTGAPIGKPMVHAKEVVGAIFSGDGAQILSWSADGRIGLWKAASGEASIPNMMRHEGDNLEAIFSHSGNYILSHAGNSLRLWHSKNGNLVAEIFHEDEVSGGVFSADDTRILSWSKDGTARLWDVPSGRPRLEPLRHRPHGAVLSARFSRDETFIFTSQLDHFRVWRAATGEPVTSPLPQNALPFESLSQDDLYMVSIKDRSAQVINLLSGKTVNPSMEHTQRLFRAGFFMDDGRIYTAASDSLIRDGVVRIWDAYSGAAITGGLHHDSAPLLIYTTQDGNHILTGSLNGTVRVWYLKDEGWPRELLHSVRQVETGTRLNAAGELTLIPPSEWRELKDRFSKR